MPKSRGDSCVVPFHTYLASSFASGTSTFFVQPSSLLSPRLLNEADAWAHFRIVRFSFRLRRNAAITSAQAACYLGGVQDSPPATLANVAEVLSSVILTTTDTVPTEWCRPTKSELSGPFPWYKSVAGAADSTEEAPGSICVAGTGTESWVLEMRGVVEFKTSVPTGATPLALELQARLHRERVETSRRRQREGLLRALSGSCVPCEGTPAAASTIPGRP